MNECLVPGLFVTLFNPTINLTPSPSNPFLPSSHPPSPPLPSREHPPLPIPYLNPDVCTQPPELVRSKGKHGGRMQELDAGKGSQLAASAYLHLCVLRTARGAASA